MDTVDEASSSEETRRANVCEPVAYSRRGAYVLLKRKRCGKPMLDRCGTTLRNEGVPGDARGTGRTRTSLRMPLVLGYRAQQRVEMEMCPLPAVFGLE